MKASLIKTTKPVDQLVTELDSVFLEDNIVVPVSLSAVDSINRADLRAYCHYRGIYTIVTTELISYLLGMVDMSQTIEIGAGNGTLSHGLGIRATDNKMQQDPMIKWTYQMMRQPVIEYPDFVEKIDAIDAIRRYKPKIVLGSWITHIYKAEEHHKGGNQWAPDEEQIMARCEKYILIGNLEQHRENRLFNEKKYDHKIYRPDCLRSRASDSSLDVVIEFTKK